MTRFLIAFLAFIFAAPSARAAGLIEESVMLPASFEGIFGADTVKLEALIVRPDDDQRHPLAVIAHGTPRDHTTLSRVRPERMRAQALEFARRGWVAVAFSRRGYGNSEGSYVESAGSRCASQDYRGAGRTSAEDIREVIRLMKQQPYVDPARIISIGRSAGGLATVALTADPPPGLVAAISFAGGRGSKSPDVVCDEQGLVAAFAAYGQTSRIPMLWVYSDNDHFFGPTLAKRFYQAFTEAGGKAEFIAAPPFGKDGHTLFGEAGAPIWTAYVDAFLARQSLGPASPPIPEAGPASRASPADDQPAD